MGCDNMRIILLLGLVLLIAGCDGKTFDASGGASRLVKAEHRAILSVERTVFGVEGQPVLDDRGEPVASIAVCAEPSPDALQSTALALGGEASAEAVVAVLKASFVRSETQDYVGLRTQTIQLLRDAYFRLCEAFMNDGVDAIAYDVLQRRFQSQIVALLAVEQLTGAVVAGRRGIDGNPATHLTRVAGLLEESEDVLLDLMSKLDKAKADLAALEAEDKKLSDEKDREKHKVEVEDARKSLSTIERQIERRQHVISKLKSSFARAVQAAPKPNATEPNGSSGATANRSVASNVADAVRAITLNAINQDYETQVCFETLRFRNHLGQFRNDVNNAFDSGGIPTNLQEGAFLEHCRNLFASQADFRNARVGAAEAFADAIRTVTDKLSNNELSADQAGSYIRALAESVPTEPGVAFLPHDPKSTSGQLTVFSKIKIRGKSAESASIEGKSAVDSPSRKKSGETQ